MNRFASLLRDSWWVWLGVLTVSGILATMVSPVFLCAIPICIVSFFYFGYIRYDENGQRREGF